MHRNHMHIRINMKNKINEKDIMNRRKEDVYANKEKSVVLN